MKLKTESDGRMFPVTDSSQTIIDCLLRAARAAGVRVAAESRHRSRGERPDGGFDLTLSSRETLPCDRLLLATGGCRAPALGRLAVSLGHTLEPPVPSLVHVSHGGPVAAGIGWRLCAAAEVSVPGTRLRERGALLVTHWGLSGPAILRLSAWGARELHDSTTGSRCT